MPYGIAPLRPFLRINISIAIVFFAHVMYNIINEPLAIRKFFEQFDTNRQGRSIAVRQVAEAGIFLRLFVNTDGLPRICTAILS